MGFSIGASSANMGPRGALDRFGDQVEGSAFNPRVVVRLLRYIMPYWRQMTVAFGLMLVSSALTLVVPYLVKIAIDQPIAQGDLPGLQGVAAVMLGAFVCLYAASSGQTYLLSWVGQRVLANLRAELFRHLQTLSLGYHDQHIVGVTIRA